MKTIPETRPDHRPTPVPERKEKCVFCESTPEDPWITARMGATTVSLAYEPAALALAVDGERAAVPIYYCPLCGRRL